MEKKVLKNEKYNTGPESSGKTTLFEQLKKPFDLVLSQKKSRTYLEKIDRP